MKFAIWGLLGAIGGAIFGYAFVGKMAGGAGEITFTIHMAITFAFVGAWCAVIFDKKATAHD